MKSKIAILASLWVRKRTRIEQLSLLKYPGTVYRSW